MGKTEENIKVLGVYFNYKIEASKIQQNWTEQINAIKLSAQRWSRRNLSLYGKVIIAKTFLLSKIYYVIQALTLPKEVLAQIDSTIFSFLWKKKHTNKKAFKKIKRNNSCKAPVDGGLGAISIKDQQSAFCIRWFQKACLETIKDSTPGQLIKHLCQTLGSFTYLTEATVKAKEVLVVECVQSEFWKIVIAIRLNFDKSMYVREFESEEGRIRKQLLFYTTEMRYKNKPL